MSFATIRVVIQGIDDLSTKLKGSLKSIKKFGQSVKKAGMMMTAFLTLPILAFGANTLQVAGDFEASMNKVQNLTRATGTEFEQLRVLARDLGATTAFSATEAAQGMGFLGMAGFNTKQIIGSMGATLTLAAASGMELGETADIMSNIMTGYKIKAEQSTWVTDVLTMAFQSSNTNLLQLGEAMAYVAPVAAGMKIPLTQTTTAIGLLSNAGIQGTRAGTNLRGILASLGKVSGEAAVTLEKLKIPKANIIDAQGNISNLRNVLVEFEKSGASTTDFLTIFGKRMGPGMQALVSQGVAAFDKLHAKIKAAGGAAKLAADTQLKGFNGQLKILKSSFQELQLAIADSGLLKFATDIITKLSNWVRNLAKTNPALLKFYTKLAMVLTVLGPILFILGGLISTFATVSAAIATAGGVIALVSNPIGWVVGGIIALIAIVTLLVAFWKKGFGKILMIIFPLGGIVSWIITRWSRLMPFFRLVGWALGKIFGMMYTLIEPLISVISFLGDKIYWLMDAVLELMETLAAAVLPEWLQKDIGLNVGGMPDQEDIAMNVRAQSAQTTRNETTVRFENSPAPMTVTKASAGMNFGGLNRGALTLDGGY